MLMVNQLIGFGAAAGGAGPPTATFVANYADTTNLTPYTFTAANIGTASADRYVIVVMAWGASANRTPSSVTLGGNAMTAVAGGATGFYGVGIYISASPVASGTTADVVVTFDNNPQRCGIVVYQVNNLVSTTAVGTATTSSDNTAMNIATTANGFAIAGATARNGSVNETFTFSGVTEDVDFTVETTGSTMATGSVNSTTGSTLAITIDASGSSSNWSFACASFY